MHFVMNKRYSEFQTLCLLARTIVDNRSDHVTFRNAMTHGPVRPAQHVSAGVANRQILAIQAHLTPGGRGH